MRYGGHLKSNIPYLFNILSFQFFYTIKHEDLFMFKELYGQDLHANNG